jgi:alkylhydroperoxidase/carboxymuconolactone decarboxylase family protein YurZ
LKHATAAKVDPEELIKRAIAGRGDIYEEFKILARTIPDAYAINQKIAGYVHQYEGVGTDKQVLSAQMRELIATSQLCAKSADRFAPNHVRKLWRMGVTNRVILEAVLAITTVVGWSTLGHAALAIQNAGDPNYRDGKVPEGGAPTQLIPFPELDLGHKCDGDDAGLLAVPAWQYVAGIDPEIATRMAELVDHALLAGGMAEGEYLSPGVRELVAIPALCARSETEIAARHIRRAYAYGMTKRQVLEAVSCVIPMSGSVTVEIGVRAMQLAEKA